MWKSDDNCTYYECTKTVQKNEDDYVTSAKINKYKKSCPPLGECPSNRVTIKDCCQTCRIEPVQLDQKTKSEFVHPIDRNTELFSKETYAKHPCRRTCRQGAPPMTCEYTFIVSTNRAIVGRN